MRTVNSSRVVTLDDGQREQLEAFARSRSLPHALVVRAKIILAAANGEQSGRIGERFHVSRHTVGKWRGRFAEMGIEGLYDEYRSGRPRSIEDEQISQLVKKTLHSKPRGRRSGVVVIWPMRRGSRSRRCSGCGRRSA